MDYGQDRVKGCVLKPAPSNTVADYSNIVSTPNVASRP